MSQQPTQPAKPRPTQPESPSSEPPNPSTASAQPPNTPPPSPAPKLPPVSPKVNLDPSGMPLPRRVPERDPDATRANPRPAALDKPWDPEADLRASQPTVPHTPAAEPANANTAPTRNGAGLQSPTALVSAPDDTILPLSTIRKSIAEHMVRSKHTSPHVTTVFEVDLSKVIAHREANRAVFARDGVNLTFTAYFVSATATALKAFPVVNSVFADDRLILKREINIGVAVSLGDEGLIVPVIKQADEKSLLGLARAVNDLAHRARAKQLKPDEVQGGTFTITNHGVSGSLFATPIISQPQCGILGVGAIQKRVVVINDAIAIRPMCYLGLTFDHRILDGAIADYFMAKVKETLEGWG